jgi:ribosomal protein S18 acetylase RimI-like enzyme
MATIRPFQHFDLPGIYRVCLSTGDSGKDATLLYRNPELLPHIYAGPYPIADPGLTFVAVDDQGVLGYIVATADTLEFETWLEQNWWPHLRAQYSRRLAADPRDGTEDWLRVSHLHEMKPTPDKVYERYPAHLHIDILPRGQRADLGRRLVHSLLEALRARRVRGLHLGVGSGNPGAFAFFTAVGFTEERRAAWGSTMVMDLRTP